MLKKHILIYTVCTIHSPPFLFQAILRPCAALCAPLLATFFAAYNYFRVLKKYISICTHQSNHRIIAVALKSVGSLLVVVCPPCGSCCGLEKGYLALRLRRGRTSPSLPVARKAGLNLWRVGDTLLWYIRFGYTLELPCRASQRISSLRVRGAEPAWALVCELGYEGHARGGITKGRAGWPRRPISFSPPSWCAKAIFLLSALWRGKGRLASCAQYARSSP